MSFRFLTNFTMCDESWCKSQFAGSNEQAHFREQIDNVGKLGKSTPMTW